MNSKVAQNSRFAADDPHTPTHTVGAISLREVSEIAPLEMRLRQASPTAVKAVARQMIRESKTGRSSILKTLKSEKPRSQTTFVDTCRLAALPKDVLCCIAKMAGGKSLARMEM